jgi:DNA-binding NarL/FixJ family response regulator
VNKAARKLMSGKSVLIISSNGLFREGLKHVLADTTDLAQMVQVSTLQEAEEMMRIGQVDVVIIVLDDQAEGQEDRAKAITSLLSRPGVRVIVVSMKARDLCIYRQERIEEASVEDLVAALAD